MKSPTDGEINFIIAKALTVGNFGADIEKVVAMFRMFTQKLRELNPESQVASAPTSKEMDFGDALVFLKKNCKITRKSWQKGVFLFLVKAQAFQVDYSHIGMKTYAGEVIPWVSCQRDLLAEDWILV